LASRLSTGLPAILPAAAVAAAVSTTTAAIFLGLGFIDIERPAIHVAAVDGGNGLIALTVIAHFDKSEAARLTGVAVGNQVDTIHRAELLKHRSNGTFGGVETKVSYKNILH